MARQKLQFIDSHTGGEPTRLIIGGSPDLGTDSLTVRRERLATKFDWVRSASVNEPRGSDVLVGGILTPPVDPECVAGVIFFNNVGYLGMCGHGMMGVIVSLAEMGKIAVGTHKVETPVGTVTVDYLGGSEVAIRNVPSYRYRKEVTIEVADHGPLKGDIAWGGNWFFLVKQEEHHQMLHRKYVSLLTDFCLRVRDALEEAGITGADDGEIDHIELFGPPSDDRADGINFVLCPGAAYDRSPCGTGTSAKAACLYADGDLKPGEIWRQESIVGSVFEVSIAPVETLPDQPTQVIPRLVGNAWVTGEGTLLIDERDPFRYGITD